MMELVKKNIHMNRWKGKVMTQITLDDDFIVPDALDDMEQVILDSGSVQIESAKNQGEKVSVKGKMDFQVLYRREGGGLQTLGGSIPFEEIINVSDLKEHDYISVSGELDDLASGMINSRKLSIKAIVTLDVKVETLEDVEAAVEVGDNAFSDSQVQVETLKRDVEVAAIAVRRKDTFRIKENLSLSGNKPNIDQILWSEMRLKGASSRPLDGKVHLDGELNVFVIYSGEGEETPVQWMEESIPFSGEVDLDDAVEEMIPVIGMRLVHKDLEAKPDYDGEMRELELDAVIELDMKLYQEEKIQMLSDLYSTNRELNLQTKEACFDQILTKNICKCKVAEKISVPHSERILQICHSAGNVKIDETQWREDGLDIEGVLEVNLLYLTADDKEPVSASTQILPFRYTAEAKGIDENSIYQLNAGLEQLTAVMLGGDTVEIKAVVTLDLLVLQPVCQSVIVGAQVEPMDVEKLQKMPGIVGYIVQPGDSLWKIAKKFHTTMDNMIATNNLTDSQIHPGDRLILVKEIAQG